ncbi:hypothetical protein OIU78_029330 [Salix suchowensis]|nr:hypothetical protein OIU78_029330 [Salix suchowensis]
MDLSVVALFMLVLVGHGARLDDQCREERCAKDGPAIRFPFRLKGKQPDHCSYPGFDLSCTERKETLLELPTSAKLYVYEIDYASQLIIAGDPDECLPKQPKSKEDIKKKIEAAVLPVGSVLLLLLEGMPICRGDLFILLWK